MNTTTFELDFAHLKSLTGDDNEFMIEILEMIVDQSPGVLQNMYGQLESQRYAELGATAHKYKSSINILGSSYLIELMTIIENTAVKGEEEDSLSELVTQFESVCDRLLGILRSEVDNLKMSL